MTSKLAPFTCSPLLIAAACAAAPPVEIRSAHDSATERRTQQQLETLFARYDLTPWTFTEVVVIDDDTIPHSHPVLTLHSRHLLDDHLLLSTYIHEQIHWCLTGQRAAVDAAVQELERTFPDLPVGFPEGADDHRSSYEHLIVILFERRGLVQTVGELAALQVMEFWSHDHYRALYRLVLQHRSEIERVVERHSIGCHSMPTRKR